MLACRWLPALAAWRGCALAALRLLAMLIAIVGGGCASLPVPVPRPPSFTPSDVASTWLGQIAARSGAAAGGDRSGCRLLPDGGEAFDARLALIRHAEKSLEVQYY